MSNAGKQCRIRHTRPVNRFCEHPENRHPNLRDRSDLERDFLRALLDSVVHFERVSMKHRSHFETTNQAMLLRGAYLLMHRRFNAVFEPLSLTADQFVLLSLLKEAGTCTQSKLATLSFADVNTVGAMLRLLERRKLVRRVPHSTDGRAKSVSLTRAGEQLRATCEHASLPLLAALDSCFSTDALASATLSRVIATMG